MTNDDLSNNNLDNQNSPDADPGAAGSTGRPRRRRLGLFAGLIGLLALGVVSVGFAGPGRGHCSRDPAEVREHAAWATDFALSRVDASDDQKVAVEASVDALIDEMLGMADDRAELRDAFRAELTADQVDPVALEALRQRGLALADEASQSLLESTIEVAETLTPEQRLELAEMAERFRGRRGGRGGPDGEREHRRGGRRGASQE